MKKLLTSLLIIFALSNIIAQETAKIIILRPCSNNYKYMSPTHQLYFDGQYFSNIPSRIYVEIIVEAGQHNMVGYVGQQSLDELKSKGSNYSLTINAIEGQTYYACIDEKRQTLSLVSEDVMQKALTAKLNPLYWLAKLELKGDIFYNNGVPVGENAQKAKKLADNSSTDNDNKNSSSKRIISDVDQNIPETKAKNPNTFALIIANEEYKNEMGVEFAENDGATFKEYCIKTLGIPAENIEFKPNATIGDLYDGVDWLENVLNYIDGSKAIVFYSGHGINDEKTGEAYLIPVDGQAKIMATCFSLNTLYKRLSATKSGNVTYFMDACFTGAGKDGAMLVAARGVAREPKKETLSGNTVVFSATNADQTAMPYTEKSHGLFTYFLLKKLQETQGNVSYKELQEYLNTNVNKYAVMVNRKPQTPTVATSPSMMQSWENNKLR